MYFRLTLRTRRDRYCIWRLTPNHWAKNGHGLSSSEHYLYTMIVLKHAFEFPTIMFWFKFYNMVCDALFLKFYFGLMRKNKTDHTAHKDRHTQIEGNTYSGGELKKEEEVIFLIFPSLHRIIANRMMTRMIITTTKAPNANKWVPVSPTGTVHILLL